MKKDLVTKSAFKKIQSGHPWLFATDIVNKTNFPDRPGVIFFCDYWWLHSPKSFIRLRRLGPHTKKWMHNSNFNFFSNSDQFKTYFGNWLSQHLEFTLREKSKLIDLPQEDLCLRWIFSENDFLPGLIVDAFGDHLVCQLNSAPIELFWFELKNLLIISYKKITGKTPEVIELRNAPARKKEGLDIIFSDDLQPPKILNWNSLKWIMTPAGSQKTGAYFDQRLNHILAVDIAKTNKTQIAWDLCCYNGGFSLHLLKNNIQVVAVDQSKAAISTAKKNVELNLLSQKNIEFVVDDVFAWLESQLAQNNKADFIILDPPSFVRSREKKDAAILGYIKLNSMALRCLKPGGLLMSCTCSHHISSETLRNIIKKSADQAQAKYTEVTMTGPSPDHMPASGFPEGHYLNALVIKLFSI